MRKGIASAGGALLVLGVVVFAIAAVGAAQAASDFGNCLNGFPSNPTFGFPSACADAMGSLWLYQGIEAIGGLLALGGIALLVIGLILPPTRPAPASMPTYPPPVYGPPGVYTPPQGPPPPPQS